ncbi:host specificity factor TipJ family phage tail protein [Malikia sp.]|uniref:host specificity factor TipJ family phage tail protein n=1 Tax=Malikia sp. TaxID=2070706 RepID=UPI0026031B87|nr:host specificity factor TipJ family phage tail protein [Malikia sp.]MDD2728165.1 host specificity factor TipJ family phage tail protein [Malikia sp.]
MITIRLYEHPFAPVAPRVFQADSVGAWLLQHYGDTPQVGLQIYSGEPSAETEITQDLQALLHGRAPMVTVLQSPGGPAIPILINIAIAIAVSVAMSLLFPPPSMPGNVNRTQQSANNGLAARENEVRLLQRVEDIYGTVRAIPSLLMPTYNKYQDHRRVEYGYYCVGRGYYDISSIRDGDSLISDISGSSASVYAPFTSPNSSDSPVIQVGDPIIDSIVTAARSVQVDGLTLKAANQIQLPASAAYTFWAAGTGDGSAVPAGLTTDAISQDQKRPNFNAICNPGDQLSISMSGHLVIVSSAVTVVAASRSYTDVGTDSAIFAHVTPGSLVTFSGFTNASNNGTFTVLAKASDRSITVTAGSQVNEASALATLSTTVDYSGTRTVTEVGDGWVALSGSVFSGILGGWLGGVTASITVDNGLTEWTEWTDWVTLPQADRTEVWVNVLAQLGMYKDNGGKSAASVIFEVQIERLTSALAPTGQVETVTETISGAVSDERAVTVERVTAWTGPTRVRARRVTPFDYDFGGTVIDEIKWADLYAVSPVGKTHFGNKTTIHSVTRATPRATAARQRQLNCLASRKLPSISADGSASGAFDAEGRHVSGTIAATSRVVDVMAAVAADPRIGNGAAQVDLVQIHGVQQQLDAWSPDAGQFNYTFDSDQTSFEETLTIIANTAFCVPYRQSGRIRLGFDRLQTSSSALFTHRNKRPNAETITRSFSTDAEYDGVEFVYQDPDTEQAETIKLPLDASATKYRRFEIPGIRSFAQAWYRANREYRKLLGQRLAIETECTTDARLLLPNSRVDIVDNTRFKSYDGEVIGQSGLVLTLSRDVAFTAGAAHSILLMKRDGSLQSIACTAGAVPNQIVLASAPAEAIVTAPGQDGIRTIFSFASDSGRQAQAWLVQEVGMSDGQYIRIKAVNYSPDYYAADQLAVPDKNTIIN